MEAEYMMTTIDNPYNPFTQYDEWLAYDVQHGYATQETLARFAVVGNNLTESENAPAINEAMDRLIEVDPYCRWIKVTKDGFERMQGNKPKTT